MKPNNQIVKINSTKILSFKNVSVEIGRKQILKEISIDILKGKVHGFIGPNGAGKTTTIKSAIGSIPITKGKIEFNREQKIKNNTVSIFGYVPESLKYNNILKVKKILEQRRIFNEISKKEYNLKVKNFCRSIFNIEKFFNEKITALSSGQQKLIMLFDSLLSSPKFLILDEPLQNLDPTLKINISNFLREFVKNEENAVLISSHGLEELQEICDDVTFIKRGKIIYSGTKNIEHKGGVSIRVISKDFLQIKTLFKKNPVRLEGDNCLVIEFENSMEVNDFAKILIKNKLTFEKIEKYQSSLLSIYKRFFIQKKGL